ncbi:MAG: hypothetical protein ABEJ67_07095 [Halanaeroarchaeum sp.]
MDWRTALGATLAGVVVAFLVGAGVTEGLRTVVVPSLVVGIPIGTVAGVGSFALVVFRRTG